MDIQQKLKSPHQPFNAFSLDQFVPNYTDALTNYGHAPANYHALQLAQAQAARLRALHSAVLNGNIIGREISLNPIANPVISPRISERLGLVIKKNHGATANSSTGANRDHDYPVFVPARQQSKETGRDSVGSNYSSESLMTPEERLNYILDHDNKGTFPGLISTNHKINANKDANHQHYRVINRHTPIKALSEFLSEEVIAWRQRPPQCRTSDGLSAQSHHISTNHGSQHRQKSVISDDPGLILGANDHGSTNRVIKQISEIASGRSCKPSKSDYSTNHNLLQRIPLIHHHRSEQSVANQAEIRGRIKADPSLLSPSLVISKEKPAEAANQNVIKANQNAIKANQNVIKANHNPIKAAWLSIRGMNGGNHSRSKGHRSKSQLGEDDRTEDVISTNHSYSGQDKHHTNHNYRGQDKNHTNHSYRGQGKHHTNDAANHKRQNGRRPDRCEGIMLREAAMAMAMEEMEAKLMEARWRRDMAIAEMEQVRLAMEQKKKMAMAMPMPMDMDRDMGMDMDMDMGMGMDMDMDMDMGMGMDMDMDMGMGMDMHRDMGMAMDRDMGMPAAMAIAMGRLKGKKAAQAEAKRKERKDLA